MAPKPAAAKATKSKTSRFKDVKVSQRAPQLGPGLYELDIVDCGVSRERSEYFKCHATVVEVVDDQRDDGDPGEGDEVLCMLQCLDGKSRKPGYSAIKALAIALAGYESEAEYDENDEDGLFCEHILNDGSDGKDADGDDYPDHSTFKVRVRVRKGKQTKDGDDYYRNNTWSPSERS